MDRQQASELLEQLLREKVGAVRLVSVDEVEERYLREKGKLSGKTAYNYRWTFGKMREAGLKNWFTEPSQVNAFISGLGVNDVSRRTIFGCLRAIGRYSRVTWGWVDATEGAASVKVEHKRRRYLTPGELESVAGACRDVEDKALILTLVDSTCRIGELAGLTVDRLEASGFTARGKTGWRHYRCDARIVALLREIAVDGVVFPAKDMGRRVVRPVGCVDAATLGMRVRTIFLRAGLTGEKLGPHTLRHTAASMVAKNTRSALAVQSLLQHDNINTSMRYIHDAEEDIQQGISPMAIGGIGFSKEVKQLALAAPGVAAVPGIGELVAGLFPEVPDGVMVRPGLSSADLRIIRDGMIALMVQRNEAGSGSGCVQLMRRMLRRV